MITEEEYWFWLCNITGIWQIQIEKLIKKFQSPEEIYKADQKALEQSKCLMPREIAAIINSRNIKTVCINLEKVKNDGVKFIYCTHPDFPNKLKNIPDRPFSLYVKGRLPNENVPAVGIVGARNCTGYGKETAIEYSEYFAKNNIQVISGMAEGIDTCAAVGAIKNGGSTFAVLGTGIDIIYPYKNIELYFKIPEKGGIISEYPPGTKGIAWHFPHRNRLISAFSDKLLIIEAGRRSGTLTTARHALNQGVDIYALPGRINDPQSAGCNMLISEGCGILLNAGYITEQLYAENNYAAKVSKYNGKKDSDGFKNRKGELIEENKSGKSGKLFETKNATKECTEAEREEETVLTKIQKCLNYEPQNVQKIAARAHLPVEETSNMLTELEIIGYAEETAKDYYAKCMKF